ncbi:NACHT, LRR and PYD domains-containing protein 3-like isoform X1 [Dysidea avara]|uniref:NACHT, LRR and PYD domains-containing protein 3-like isoform X1 n=1 Tax=Dysidea avara TaxID=196820 RepID=UPI00332C6F00
MGGPGIGKTTLANEICVKWAKRDGFLAEDYDIVILIPLRSVQQRSIEEVMMEHVGEETYEQVKKSAGSRCLVILEGLDEMVAERRESDPFLVRVVKKPCALLEEATIMITSRPHACEKIDAGRRVEVIGFGEKEIQTFIEEKLSNDLKCVEEFSQQLKEYPHLESLSYVPMNLVMIVDIFECSEKKLPSTITQLYRLFIVMTLERQVRKENERKQVRRWKWKDPKIIFTVADLKEYSIAVTAEWDGYGLLKVTHTYARTHTHTTHTTHTQHTHTSYPQTLSHTIFPT